MLAEDSVKGSSDVSSTQDLKVSTCGEKGQQEIYTLKKVRVTFLLLKERERQRSLKAG